MSSVKLAIFVSLLFLLGHAAAHAASPWPLSARDLAYLREIQKETWHYIDFYVSPATGLPYDSNQAKDITNTTNVGLYLASLCMAYKLGYVSEPYALARVTKILDSLDRYEHWKRLYSNWLDPEGKQLAAKPGESNISDYNKLPAGIVVVRQTFPSLAARCSAFLDEIPWKLFHEPGTDKTCYAFDVTARRVFSPVHFFRGEDKILGHFLMIASEEVPPSTWDRHDRAEEERYGYKYFNYGWQGGGLFMHFICNLFLDNRGTPLGRSAANFAWAQIVHAQRISAPVWGWSACVAPNGVYLGMGHIADAVVTPHASALAVHLFPREVVANLRRLESLGLREPSIVAGKPERFGFRDAVNWKTGEITDKYLVLDQAMLFLSLVNYCEGGLLWKTFGSDPLAVRGKELIRDYRDAAAGRKAEEEYLHGLSDADPGAFWLVQSGRTPRPGDSLQLSLWGRSLSDERSAGCSVDWQILDGAGQAVHTGRDAIELRPWQTRNLLRLAVLTDDAGYGDVWKLESRTVCGDRTISTYEDQFRFISFNDLAGTWRLSAGDDPAWSDPAFDDSAWAQVKVPLRWEDSGLPDYDGMAWYRLTFKVTPDNLKRWGDRPLAIALGAVDDADETFLNGELIGSSGKFPPDKETAYNVPRVYAFDRALLGGTNVLAVRVGDWMGNGGIWRGPVAVGPAGELEESVKSMTP